MNKEENTIPECKYRSRTYKTVNMCFCLLYFDFIPLKECLKCQFRE